MKIIGINLSKKDLTGVLINKTKKNISNLRLSV